MNRHLLLAVAAAFLAACAAKDTTPAAAKADPPYVFPHSPHVENDVDCKACHAAIATAKNTALQARVRHVGLPTKNGDACSGCHDDKDFKEKIKLAIPRRTRAFDVRMDHAAHLAKPGVTCVTCHKALPEAGQVQPAAVPMDACTACHNHQADFKAGRCTPCHVDLKKYEKPVAAFQHTGDFLKLHGALARPTAESCAACHDQTFCADCHSGATAPARQSVLFPEQVQRDFIHRGDFQSRHMVEAGANPASCRKCHGSNFCDSCHTQRNLTQSAGVQPRNPHPAGWGIVGSGDFHGPAARKNIVACAGCHDNGGDAICVLCHKVGGRASSPALPNGPHPASFVSKHKGDDKSKRAVCMACHPVP